MGIGIGLGLGIGIGLGLGEALGLGVAKRVCTALTVPRRRWCGAAHALLPAPLPGVLPRSPAAPTLTPAAAPACVVSSKVVRTSVK